MLIVSKKGVAVEDVTFQSSQSHGFSMITKPVSEKLAVLGEHVTRTSSFSVLQVVNEFCFIPSKIGSKCGYGSQVTQPNQFCGFEIK